MILDTSVALERVEGREPIGEDITAVTLVEYPKIVYYTHFGGRVIFPVRGDYLLAHKVQLAILKMGRPQAFSDLLTAAVVIDRDEELSTYDEDFKHISEAAEKLGLSKGCINHSPPIPRAEASSS